MKFRNQSKRKQMNNTKREGMKRVEHAIDGFANKKRKNKLCYFESKMQHSTLLSHEHGNKIPLSKQCRVLFQSIVSSVEVSISFHAVVNDGVK